MSLKQALWLLPPLALGLTACRPSAPREVTNAVQSSPSLAGAESQHVGAPVEVHLRGPAAPRVGRVELTLVVERRGRLAIPLTIDVRSPRRGRANLLGPTTPVVLAATPQPSRDEVAIALDCASIPEDDLVVIVDGQSSLGGYHAEVAYRFGRPEPIAQRPALSQRSLRIGGHDLGRPVEMPAPSR